MLSESQNEIQNIHDCILFDKVRKINDQTCEKQAILIKKKLHTLSNSEQWILNLFSFMQIDHHHFFHAVFYHFRCEEILFSFPFHCYFPVVFLEKDRFGFFITSFISDLCTMNLCSILRKKNNSTVKVL